MKAQVELLIPSRTASIGESLVRRSLPSSKRRMVGPFIFLDHAGPERTTEKSIGVLPHPHIGLSTVTYLFEGESHHRDSVGSSQIIRPGDVNWMTAGRGIVHSERVTDDMRNKRGTFHGIQIWVALPKSDEECEPTFKHYASRDLPSGRDGDISFKVIAGEAFGMRSSVVTHSPLVYCEIDFKQPGALSFSRPATEIGIYSVYGDVKLNDTVVPGSQLAIVGDGKEISISTSAPSKVLIIGGAPLEGSRLIWWNFVSSSRDRLVAAKEDWIAHRFEKIPGDSVEFVPAPDKEIP